MARLIFLGGATLLASGSAFAHSQGMDGGLMSGMAHPVLGPDHLLAMVCVGIVSVQLGGSSVWRVPAAFVVAMIVGGSAGFAWPGSGFAEMGIALSLVALGVCVAARQRVPAALVMACVGVFGFCHGYAHGVEIPHTASPLLYTFGFVTSTVVLHVLGVGLGFLAARGRGFTMALRTAGAAVGLLGVAYLTGLAG